MIDIPMADQLLYGMIEESPMSDEAFDIWVKERCASLRRQIGFLERNIKVTGDRYGLKKKVLEWKTMELGAIEGCLL